MTQPELLVPYSDDFNAIQTEAISTHLDDAVLSYWLGIGVRTRVTTVFSGIPQSNNIVSNWDKRTGFISGKTAMETRIQENQAALENVASQIVNLGFLDHVYNGSSYTPEEIAERIEGKIDPEALIVAPAAIDIYSHNWIRKMPGQAEFRKMNPDHTAVRLAVMELMDKKGREVELYIDLPYSLPFYRLNNWPERLPIEEIKKQLGFDVIIEPHELTKEQQADKHKAVEAYASQYPQLLKANFGVLKKQEAWRWEATIKPN
jgi:LmbE family N-acetylglucosaminyl deacetylase